ncbi:elongation factor G [Bifidobacterium leontopitheci]|uniref:GTP-binding protein n=1 Tax=Bifidobacterium leontopitheci TaxID=2650774 RepID=A0A6I1GI13_9BIFI|nr:TetM/TetW/TetO/TetS family tetracycline resistance ribosomal protection protein [Bifidobacterium leontopitheci]KAB7791293.1 GTP-binding protein [Bifidobacterium leontopitheci]
MKKHIVMGILAHVDAGKTTLSEALLYRSGQIRKAGRVDHGDSFLDTDAMERARGITIYAEPAVIETGDLTITLIDTPGHVDFSAETERVLPALDYAVLVVSGADGIQGHTETLWRLLERYHVPAFLFVNKMDAPGADRNALLASLRRRFGDGCIDMDGGDAPEASEDVGVLDETAMDELLGSGSISSATMQAMIAKRELFPVYFGAALQMDGVDALLAGIERYARQPAAGERFAARVFKVSHDVQGNRLTWLKVTGGELRAKMVLDGDEKADQVRWYSGAKFTTVDALPAGSVCAVTGLTSSFPGQGLGECRDAAAPMLQPVLTFTLLPGGNDVHRCLTALRELDDEDPLLHVVWQERLQEIHVQLMGEVQLEIIQQILHDRFGLDVTFGPGSILYKETVTHAVEGVGHFEPLRHYAEAHVLIEPAEPGSGVTAATACSENTLARNWQRLIMTHIAEKEHLGPMAGFPLTDVRITLLTGRAHEKHTEGGDFRQATYRAIRQGLMSAWYERDFAAAAALHAGDGQDSTAADAEAADAPDGDVDERPNIRSPKGSGWCRVLEPWYRYRLDIPQDMLGRAMADVQRMSGMFDTPAMDGERAVLTGSCPASEMRGYAMDVNAYTHGRGHLTCTFGGYLPCHDEDAVVAKAGYNAEADMENTPDSVFCAHGAGYPVRWYRVPEFMHLPFAYDGESGE